MKYARLILILMCVSWIVIGCGSKGGNSASSDKKSDPATDLGKAKLAELDASGIRDQNFKLKTDLSFADADHVEFKFMEGTAYETPMVRYAYAFSSQRRLNASELDSAPSYCAVFIETNVDTPIDGLLFHAQEKLLKGQFETSSHNADMAFAIQLQGAHLQSFFLSCKNVTSIEQLDAHIGQLIQTFQ